MRDLAPLLSPRSVAVVGASANLDSVAGKPVRHLRDSGVDLAIYPVNPNRDEIGGLRAYPSPADLPVAPDVALVVVPAPAVLPALEALAARGARSAIVVSAGFAEAGSQGAADQRRLGELARAHDMIICGPNTLGVHDYARGLALSFVWYGRRAESGEGAVAVVSQSGSGMTSLCDRLLDAGLPLGLGISTGNEADLTIVDALEYLAEQPAVRVIAAVLEEVRDGPRFLAVCRRLREVGKPLVAMKVGRTDSGAAVVRSHTGALAGSYPVLRALLRQHGVIEVGDVDDLGPTVAAALPGKYPAGNRFAVVTSSGGAAAMSADRADEIGLVMPPFSAATRDRIRALVPAVAGAEFANPLDLTAQTMERPHALFDIAEIIADQPTIDAVIAAVPSGGGHRAAERGRRLAEVAAGSDKPVLAVILSGSEADEMRLALRAGGVGVFSSPARAVDALEKLRRFAVTPGDEASDRAQAAIRSADLSAPPDVASEFGALRWLGAHGLPVIDQRLAATASEAVGAAAEIGFPVVVKISSPDIAHKTEVGGVRLGVTTPDEVRHAFEHTMSDARAAVPSAQLDGVTISPMINQTLELIVGVHRDPTFGLILMLGIGGIWAETLADVALRGVPVRPEDVGQMVDELRGAALLRGARGRPTVNLEALSALLTTLSRFAEACGPSLNGIDLNPVAVTADGDLTVLDAAIFLHRAAPDGKHTKVGT